MTDNVQQAKAPKDRSPSFPFIPLETALERLVAFDKTFGRHSAPASKVGLAWKIKEGSSQAAQVLAALKAFGLVDYNGVGDDRTASITDDGRIYLRAQQESIKAEVVKRLALKPKIIQKYWSEWGSDRPPTPLCLDTLVLKGGFTQSAANTFLRVYDATIHYAKLSDSDKIDDDDDDDDRVDEMELQPPTIDVGDFVRVEINGQTMFASPVRVRAVQHHEGKPWFYVEGSESGVSMEHIQLHQKGTISAFTPPLLPLQVGESKREAKAGFKEERLIDDSGDETFISYKGEPSVQRYEFIRDYLDFRIQRLKKQVNPSSTAFPPPS